MQSQAETQHLRKVLREVERLVTRSGLPVSLNQGIKRAKLDSLLAELEFPVPAEVQCIYEWRNGTSGNCSLIPEFQFLPFERVVLEIRDSSGYRPKGWLPLLTRDGDSFYLDVSPRGGDCVRFFWHEGDESSRGASAFDSVQLLFETIAEAYRQEMFVVAKTTATIGSKTKAVAYLEANDREAWDALKARLNPRSAAMWLPRKESEFEKAMRAIDLHIEEMRQHGSLRSQPNTRELRAEIKCIDFSLQNCNAFMSRSAKSGSTINRTKLLEHVRSLQNLKRALQRISRR